MRFAALQKSGENIYRNFHIALSFVLVMMLDTEQLCDLMLVNMGADDAKTTDDGSRAGSDISLTGNVIKVDPFTVFACDDTFSAQHDAVLNSVL
jgi:hypothetical protein